jgi:diguanylate cyclase (GGDEF)-like protein
MNAEPSHQHIVRPETRASSRQRFILIGIAGVTAIVAGTVVLISMQRESAITAFQTATTNLGNGMAQQTSQMIGSFDQALKDIVRQLPSASNATPKQIQWAMRSIGSHDLLVDLKKGLRGVNALAMIDADGRIANTSGAWSMAVTDVSQQDFFDHFKTKNDQDAFVSMPTRSAVTGEWISYLARRVNDARGNFSGIVVGELSLAAFENFYRVAMPIHRSVTLLRQDGVVLVRYPARDNEVGKKIPERPTWYSAIQKGGAAYHASDFFTATKIIAFVRPLDNLPLAVQASVTEADVLADWPRQVMWLVLGAIAAIVALLLLLRFLARQVGRLERSQSLLIFKNEEIKTAHIQFDAALANISLGVCFFDANKKLIACNRAYREMYILSPEATQTGTSFAEIVNHRYIAGTLPRCTPEEYMASRDAVAMTGERKQSIVELVNEHAILITHQPMPNGGWVATHEDITERREAERHLLFLAHHDPLTRLANRTYFTEKLDEALARLQRNGEPFSIFFLDLDRFKNVNDTLGHPAGDQLIRETAQRLKEILRETDVLARLGGDEFAILQQGKEISRKNAVGLATRILKIFTKPFDLNGNKASVGISIGIALAPDNASTSTDILKMADIALYGAKAAGRNGFLFFEAAMLSAVADRHQLKKELELAIERGEFELHYQALINATTRRQAGFEALVRWRSPTRGLIMPDQFIPIAEETGLILPLGAWILKKACVDAANWPSQMTVAVNLSPVQLAQPDLLKIILEALADSSLLAERLELEITETALFKNDVDCLNLIRQLKRLGVSIVLDDFGTGFSSLSYLTMIPFDKIKIDQSFTLNMTGRADCAAIVAAIIALGRSLNTSTVAEGVETEEQFQILRKAGVTLVQGYLFGRPCPLSELAFDDVAARLLDVQAPILAMTAA